MHIYNIFIFMFCSTPDNVAMIVLPVSPVQEDVGIQIQHTLIQAFCWENDIRVIKVGISFRI